MGINLCFILLVLPIFIGTKDFSASQTQNSKKIGACYADLENSYFSVLNNEISATVEENGDFLITRDSIRNQEKQNEQIHELIEDGVIALIIAPVNWKTIKPALVEAKAAGVYVVIVDSQVYDEDLVDCTVTSDNYNVGLQLASYLKSQKSTARILLVGVDGVKSSYNRLEGFKEGISKEDAYTIIARTDCNGTMDDSMNVVTQAIIEGESFDCIFAVNDLCAIGAISACEKSNITSYIEFLSTDGSPEGKQMIKDSIMMASAAQFPAEMGTAAVESLYKIINGEDCETNILVPVKLITAYTIDSYDTEKWQ